MASTIKVNNIQNTCGANIISESANTITLGASGDNIVLGAGATQSGFGRTGTVDWDTTAKTTNFTAVSGTGYFVNTTSGAITVTLPASPSAGDIVAISDYARTFGTNAVTVGRNSSNIQGSAFDATISTAGQSTTFVYVDGTQGWIPTEDQTTNAYGAQYIVATGGTVTTCGNYKIHTFTSPGTFCVSCGGNAAGSNTVDYLVVAGGGGGGGDHGGAGGAGGFRFYASPYICSPYPASPLNAAAALPVTATAYPITVGGGGAGGPGGSGSTGVPGSNGSNSVFSTITSTAGGFGSQSENPGQPSNGGPGGSGGGAGTTTSNTGGPGGAGNTPPTNPSQGQPGGTGYTDLVSFRNSGGGGGALVAGTNAGPANSGYGLGGNGGGFPTTHFGSNGELSCSVRYFAGGGGGGGTGIVDTPTPGSGIAGGLGGGGNGGTNPCQTYPYTGTSGTANTGGGGGGDGQNISGYAGGSGIVIIRYKYQ